MTTPTDTSVRMPRVSVVIPTYNRQDLVVEAIESVLAQTYRDFEVIVVDDGSTDGTEAQLQRYAATGRIRYERQENRGLAAARNTGIRQARGEFICFLDDDDLWEPTKLSVQIEFADAHPQYALIATEIIGCDIDLNPTGQNKVSKYRIRNGWVAEDLLFANWLAPSTVMVRRECLDQVGEFDEDKVIRAFAEDWLMWMRVASKFQIYFIPEPLVRYRYHSRQMSADKPEEQFRSLMLCLQKIAELPAFRKRPHLVTEAEYRICLARAWENRSARHYDLAVDKLRQARRLRKFSAIPLYLLARTFIEKHIRGQMRPKSSTSSC